MKYGDLRGTKEKQEKALALSERQGSFGDGSCRFFDGGENRLTLIFSEVPLNPIVGGFHMTLIQNKEWSSG